MKEDNINPSDTEAKTKEVTPDSFEKIKKSKKDKKKGGTSDKIIQSQFTTALRNHISLSSMADNKANIMISINVLVITVAYSLMVKDNPVNKFFLIPTILLLASCVCSMVFATLATRPIRMKGYASMDSIVKKTSSLFFFGNFYKMDLEEYKNGMKVTLDNGDILNAQIIRDLFFLGKALGKKYEFLRKSYSLFMYGIIISVISFIIVFSFL